MATLEPTTNETPDIIFTIGRMNPPTPGHLLLIEKMIAKAASLHQNKIGIILSHTQNIPKNPLICDEKRNLLQLMIQKLKEKMKNKMSEYIPPITEANIDKIEPIIICMDDITPYKFGKHPILKSINALLDNYNYPKNPISKMELIIGQDREFDYGWIGDSLSKKKPPINLTFFALERPENAISATEIRTYVINNEWQNFYDKMQKSGLNEEQLRKLFDDLKILLTATGPARKKSRKGGRKKTRRTPKRQRTHKRRRI